MNETDSALGRLMCDSFINWKTDFLSGIMVFAGIAVIIIARILGIALRGNNRNTRREGET